MRPMNCYICGKPVTSELEGALDTDPQGRVRAFHFRCIGRPTRVRGERSSPPQEKPFELTRLTPYRP